MPAAKAAKPTAKAATVPAEHIVPADIAPRGLARDAAGIVRAATFFDQYSDRDTAYLRFYGSVMRSNNHTATLRQLHDAGTVRAGAPSRKRYNPHYNGSGKATDIGAINRLIKAGYLTYSADGNTLTATDIARKSAAYLGTGTGK
jgi:hypothetical protein